MLKFLKDNSYMITKLILNQIGSTILGLCVSVVATTNRPWLFAFVSLFATCFYLFLLYSAMWEEGGKERIKVDGGRADMKPLRGLWIALAANVPNMILAFLVFIGFLFGSTNGIAAWEWAGNIGGVAAVIARLFEAMYLGLIQTLPPANPLTYVVIIIPGVAVAAGAYALGLYNRRLFGFAKVNTKK